MSEDPMSGDDIDERRRSLLITSATVGLFGVGSAVTGGERTDDGAAESDETSSSATPDEFLNAIATDEIVQSITSVEFEGVDSQITTLDTSIQGFPTGNSSQFAAMSSGVADDVAGSPETFVSTSVDGVYEPDFSPDGFDAYDVATLSVELTVPEGAENLAFDYKFGTEENPGFLGAEFQDFFEAIVFEPDGSTQPIGLLPDGSPVTVDNANNFSNSPGGSSDSPTPPLPDPQDTTFNAVTNLQTANYNLSGLAGEEILLVIRVADASDGIFDAGVFIDNLRFAGKIDQPAGFLNVEEALDQYRDAAIEAIEAEARAQAHLEAAFYDRYGSEYTTPATDLWGYKAGLIDGQSLDDEFIESSEALFQDLEQGAFDGGASIESRAEMLYNFKSELYDAMSGADDREQLAFGYYTGTNPNQSNQFTVGGQTIEQKITAFEDEFDSMSADIIATLENQNPGAAQVDRFAANINSATQQLRQYSEDMVKDAERLITKFDQEGENIDLDILAAETELSSPRPEDSEPYTTSQPVDPQVALGGAGLIGIGVGGAALGIKGFTGFKAATVIGGSLVAGGAVLTAWAAASKTIYAMTTKLVKHVTKELIKEWAKKQIERALERNFGDPDGVGAKIEAVTVSDVDESDLSEESLLTTWWNTVMDFFDAIFGYDWSTTEYGRQTAEVTVTNTRVETLYPVFSIDLYGWKPQSEQGTYERIGLPVEWSGPVPGKATVEPGETKTFSFDYRVPINAYDQAEASVSVSDAYLTSELDTEKATFSIDAPGGIIPVEVFSGSVPEGETVSGTYMPSSDTELLACALTYNDYYLDLHFYDSNGNHTGFDYDSGTVQTEIPGSSYSGRDTGDENLESVAIDSVESEEFTVEVVAPIITTLGSDGKAQSPTVSDVSSTAVEIDGDAVSNEVPVLPGRLDFATPNVMQSGASGGTITGTVTVEETNGFTGIDDATLSTSSLEHYDDSIPAGNVSLGADGVSVNAGGSTTVDLSITVPEDAQPGKYEGTITVATSDTSDELTLRLIVDPDEVPPALEGTDLPKDLNGDGRYEDVDADGTYDIFDVQEFFLNFDRPVVEENAEYFDFDESGSINIFDVQEMFEDL